MEKSEVTWQSLITQATAITATTISQACFRSQILQIIKQSRTIPLTIQPRIRDVQPVMHQGGCTAAPLSNRFSTFPEAHTASLVMGKTQAEGLTLPDWQLLRKRDIMIHCAAGAIYLLQREYIPQGICGRMAHGQPRMPALLTAHHATRDRE